MADKLLASVPSGHRDRLARFLADLGLPEQALAVAQDSGFRFELALKSGGEHILTAHDIAKHEFREGIDEHQWRALAYRAIAEGRLALALEASQRASDWPAVLLLQACTSASATGKDDSGSLASKAKEAGHLNVSIAASLASRDSDAVWLLLRLQGRHAEAAFFARTYLPHRIDESVSAWRTASVGHPVAQLMADVLRNKELFDARVVALSSSSRPKGSSFSSEEEKLGGNKADRSHSLDYTVSSSTTTITTSSSATNATNTMNNNPALPMEDSISMEVNTTGTGSIRADDLDDIFAVMKVGVASGTHPSTNDIDGDENNDGGEHLQGGRHSKRLFPHPEEDEVSQLASKDQHTRHKDNPPPQANLTDDDPDANNEDGSTFYEANAKDDNTEDEDALMADMEADNNSAWSKTH